MMADLASPFQPFAASSQRQSEDSQGNNHPNSPTPSLLDNHATNCPQGLYESHSNLEEESQTKQSSYPRVVSQSSFQMNNADLSETLGTPISSGQKESFAFDYKGNLQPSSLTSLRPMSAAGNYFQGQHCTKTQGGGQLSVADRLRQQQQALSAPASPTVATMVNSTASTELQPLETPAEVLKQQIQQYPFALEPSDDGAAVFSPSRTTSATLSVADTSLTSASLSEGAITVNIQGQTGGLQSITCGSKAELQALLEESFGAYLIEHKQVDHTLSPEMQTRRSIDLLLDVPSSSGTNSSRHSLDSLQELLSPRWTIDHTFGYRMNSAISSAAIAAAEKQERRSAEADLRKMGGDKDSASRRLTANASFARAISTGAFHDLANSSVTVLAKPTNVAGAGNNPGPAGAVGGSVTACASSLVDVAPKATLKKGGIAVPPGRMSLHLEGSQASAMLDADVHDTFGAHAWYCGPGSGATITGTSGNSIASNNSGGGALAAAARSVSPPVFRYNIPTPAQTPAEDAYYKNDVCAGSFDYNQQQREQQQQQEGINYQGLPMNQDAAPITISNITGQPVVKRTSPGLGGSNNTGGGLPSFSVCRDNIKKANANGSNTGHLYDTYCSVPSYDYLRQRHEAKLRLQQEGIGGGGGYIAEAKRVLSDAMKSASRSEADLCEATYSGAIGPLVRYLRQHKGNDAALLSGLHTLALLVSNAPNRAIIASYEGQSMLVELMRSTKDLSIKEQAVQILWDVSNTGGTVGTESSTMFSARAAVATPVEGEEPVCAFQVDDLLVLISVLEETSSAITASQVLHLLHTCVEPSGPCSMECTPDQASAIAARLVKEVASHKHHLQDAAQYSLGMLLAAVLGNKKVSMYQVGEGVTVLLNSLLATTGTSDVTQCQVLLTVLSCLAGNHRVREILTENRARVRLLEFSAKTAESRMRTRALSLAKVLNREEDQSGGAGWYFGPTNTSGT